MADSHLITRFTGLAESVNPYAVAPEGAMTVADNCVIRSRGILESRRGYASVLPGAQTNGIGFKQQKLLALAWQNSATGVTGALQNYDFVAKAFTSMPMNPGGLELNSPGGTGAGTRFVSAQKAIYFQSRYGLTKIEDIGTGVCRAALQPRIWTTTTADAGILTGVYINVVNAFGSSLWLANGFQVAYRATVCRKGANNELIESEPSDRLYASNTSGGAASVTLFFNPGWMTPPDAFYRLYRSKEVANGTDPSDEMFLVAEIKPGTTTDSAGYLSPTLQIAYVDQTPDSQLYLPLYTNAISGSGIQSANAPAPLAQDMFWFKRRMYYFNTQDVQRLTLKIIGTGTGGILDGDSIAINGVAFTFRVNAVVGTRDTKLFTAGTVAQNIENTARYLANQINTFFASTYLASGPGGASRLPIHAGLAAYYISTSSTDAGQVLVQSAIPGSTAFTVQTSSANGWGTDYTAAVNSDPNAQSAGLMWSNFDQPEGVPLANNAPVGDASGSGQRGIPLKEAALLFKNNDGLWRVTDDGSSLGPIITISDPTVKLLAPETAVALNNLCFCLVEQGVIAIAENGQRVDVGHDQVYRELIELIAYVGRPTVAAYAFAVAYEAERTYVLNVPETSNSTYCTRQYVYNLDTQAWTCWTIPATVCGQVNPDTSQLTFGLHALSQAPGGASAIWTERKNFDSTDYQDPGFTIASPASTAVASLVFSGDKRTGPQAIAVGDLIQQPQTTNFLQQRVTAVAYASATNQTTVTLDAAPNTAWSIGSSPALTIVKAIQCTPRFLPFHAGAPLVTKDWGDIYFAFRLCDLDFITFAWSTELVPTPGPQLERVSALTGAPIVPDQFAAAPFDTTVFGKQTRNIILKTTLPQAYASAALLTLQMTLACALQRWELGAIDARVESIVDNVVR